MTQFTTLVLGIALAASLSAQPPKGTAAALQGTWAVSSLNGQSAPEGAPAMTVTFMGDKYHQTLGDKVIERGTFKVDAAKEPMTIDLVIAEGDDAGKAQMGLAEVTGDTMRMSLDTPGAGRRPTDFTSKDGVVVIAGKKTKG